MPELPEVETIRRGIMPHLVGCRIKTVLVREPRLRWPVSPGLGQSAVGQCIQGVSRRAKYLLIETAKGKIMLHLGMSGSLRILDANMQPEKHDHVDFVLDNKTLLRYRDPRRFGSIFWIEGQGSHRLLASLGPEPLQDAFDADYLYGQSRNKKIAIKLLIMNSHIVAGVGNIYANEALFLAAIRPDNPAGKIAKPRYEHLVQCIKQVLSAAILAGGTSLRDFVREDGKPGYFRQALSVYGRGGKPCASCRCTLTEVRMGQRSTVFCRRCQR